MVYLIHPQVINQKYNRVFLREEYEYQKDEFESVMQNNNFVRLDEFHLNYQTGLKWVSNIVSEKSRIFLKSSWDCRNFTEILMGWAVFKSGLDLDGIKLELSELDLVLSGRRPVVWEFNGIDWWRRDELGTVDWRVACS